MPADAPTESRESEEDGRVAAALAEYQAAVEAGTPPPKGVFLARFPDLAARLADCLIAMEAVRVAVTPPPRPPASSLAVGERLGQFRIVREIGRGGMGVVFAAVEEPLGRQVALKVLPVAGATDGRAVQRFRHEAQAAATLQHPHIVPLFSVGSVGALHYFAMQFIDGESLAAHLRRRGEPTATPAVAGEDSTRSVAPPPVDGTGDGTDPAAHAPTVRSAAETTGEFRDAARLIGQAADALQHAHDCGIVHRDVKPANLLVDRTGHLWVADFGLAKLPDSDLTGTKDLMGTVRYMSPEQASGRAVALDGRTDVYSLGVTFYECLVGRPPFEADDRHTLLRMVTEDEPTPPRKRNRAVPRDLETVCLKAMAKDPAERYQTAAAFRDDLQRYLDDRPVEAKPPTLPQRAGKWVKRNRVIATAAAAAATVVAVVSVSVLAVSNAAIAEKQRVTQAALDGQTRALEAEQVARGESQERLRRSLIDQAAAVRLTRKPGQRLKSLELLREAAAIRPADELRHDLMASFLLTDWEVIEPAPADRASFPANFFDYLERQADRTAAVRRKPDAVIVEQVPLDPGSLTNKSVSPDGRYVFTIDTTRGVVWDRERRRAVVTTASRPRHGNVIAWTDDSRHFIFAGQDKKVYVHDLSTGAEVASWTADPKRDVAQIAAHAGSKRVAVAFPEPAPGLRVFDLTTGKLVGDLPVAVVPVDLLWSRSGFWLAAAAADGFVHLWRQVGSPEEPPIRFGSVLIGTGRVISLNDFTPAEDLLLVNGQPRTWTLVSPHDLAVVNEHTPPSVPPHNTGNSGVFGLGRPGCVFAADGRTVGWMGQIRYRVVQPGEVRRLARPLLSGYQFAIGSDGRTCTVVSGVQKTTATLYSLDGSRAVGACELPKAYRGFLTDTAAVWGYNEDTREVTLRQPESTVGKVPSDATSVFTRVPAGIQVSVTPTTFQTWPKHALAVARAYGPPKSGVESGLVFEQDVRRQRVAKPGFLPGLYFWPPNDPAAVRFLDVGLIDRFALDPTGRTFATQQANENLVKVWDYPTGKFVRALESTTSDTLVFSPDGRFLVQYDRGGVAVWRTDTWARVFEQNRLPVNRVSAAAFSADGKLFAVGDGDDIVLRRTADFSLCLKWESPGQLTQLAFTPDAHRLVGCAPQGVWAWDLGLVRRQLRELNLDWSDDAPDGSSAR